MGDDDRIFWRRPGRAFVDAVEAGGARDAEGFEVLALEEGQGLAR